MVKFGLCMQCIVTSPFAGAISAFSSIEQFLGQSSGLSDSSGSGDPNSGEPGPDSTSLSNNNFLLISSPSTGKVAYTMITEFESNQGHPSPLITSGLKTPMGVAFDPKKGYLYVADKGVPAIYRYTIVVNRAKGELTLVQTGDRLTVQLGHPAEWVTVDDDGNLFYTAPDTNNINKISTDVMDDVAKGAFQSDSLIVVSQKTLQAQEAARAPGDDEPATAPQILRIYESRLNPHVSAPAAIWAAPPDLYWTNTRDGTHAGTIVKGLINPKIGANSSAPFPAEALTNRSTGAFALAKLGSAFFFTQNGTKPNTGLVSALQYGDVVDIVTSLEQPRGLAWDGDMTMYVADSKGGNVWSFPAGRFMANPPLKLAVPMVGAYGLAMLSYSDPCFQRQVDIDTNQAEEEKGNWLKKEGASFLSS